MDLNFTSYLVINILTAAALGMVLTAAIKRIAWPTGETKIPGSFLNRVLPVLPMLIATTYFIGHSVVFKIAPLAVSIQKGIISGTLAVQAYAIQKTTIFGK